MALLGAVIGDSYSSNSDDDVFLPAFEQLVLPGQQQVDQVKSERLRPKGRLGTLQGLGKENVTSAEFFRKHDAILSQLGKGRKAIQSFITRKEKEKEGADRKEPEPNPVYSEVDRNRSFPQDVKIQFETPTAEFWAENPWRNSDKWERISPRVLREEGNQVRTTPFIQTFTHSTPKTIKTATRTPLATQTPATGGMDLLLDNNQQPELDN